MTARERREREEIDRLRRAQEIIVAAKARVCAALPARPSPIVAAPAPSGPNRWVYFIGCEVTGLVKIGRAQEPSHRLRTLQCGSPTELRILRTVVGDRQREIDLHRRFASSRRHGEWFAIGEAEIASAEGATLEEMILETNAEMRTDVRDEYWLRMFARMWGDAIADDLAGDSRGTGTGLRDHASEDG